MRKILRNIMKEKNGNNNIRQQWRNMQIKKYGEQEWLNMYKNCKSKSLYKNEIYMI